MADGRKLMKAAVLLGHGGPEKLVVKQVSIPVPKANEVLIKVKACSVNNTDINTRTGWYTAKSDFNDLVADKKDASSDAGTWGNHDNAKERAPMFPRIQGADIFGEVVEDPKGGELAGQRVLCFSWIQPTDEFSDDYKYIGSELDGGYAEYVAIPRENVFPVDSQLSDHQLSAIPCAYSTAMNMVYLTRVNKKDTLLIRGASGGVGSAAIQLCQARGAKTIALVRAGKEEMVRNLGADHVITTDDKRWEHVGRIKFTVCLDVVGGPDFKEMMAHMPTRGRYACSGAIDNPLVSFDIRDFYLRDCQLYGATRMGPEVFQELIDVLEKTNYIQPKVAKVFPLEEIHEAQKYFQAKKFVGKVVIQIE